MLPRMTSIRAILDAYKWLPDTLIKKERFETVLESS